MSKRIYTLFVVLLALMMLLAACKPAAEQQAAEQAAPAEEEAAPAEEEAAPAEEEAAPAEEEAAPEEEAPAVPEDEWGNLVFAPGDEIIVGLSSALTGDYAVYGNDMLNGVNLAIEKFGGNIEGWTLVAEGGDDGCDGAPGVTVAEQFASYPNLLGVIGPMCSGSTVPASDVYGEHNIVMISPSSTAVVVTARGYQTVFRTVANDDLQAEVTVDFLVNELGLSVIAIAHDQSIYGEGLAQAVSDKFEAAGGTVQKFEGITRGEVDFSAVVSTLMADSPEAVYFGGMDAEGALLVQQLRAAGFEGVFFGPDGVKSKPTFVDGSGGAAEGAYITFGAVGGATGYEEFEAAFTEKYGEPVAYGPGSYDSTMILLQAAASVAIVDGEGNLVIGKKALADAVRSTPFEGVTGHLEFTETGDLSVVSVTVFQVVDGEIVEVKTYDFGE